MQSPGRSQSTMRISSTERFLSTIVFYLLDSLKIGHLALDA
jgi:hypothetical protein